MKLLSYDEASRLLKVRKSTLQAWVSTGRVRVPHVRLAPRTVRFIEEALIEWVRLHGDLDVAEVGRETSGGSSS